MRAFYRGGRVSRPARCLDPVPALRRDARWSTMNEPAPSRPCTRITIRHPDSTRTITRLPRGATRAARAMDRARADDGHSRWSRSPGGWLVGIAGAALRRRSHGHRRRRASASRCSRSNSRGGRRRARELRLRASRGARRIRQRAGRCSRVVVWIAIEAVRRLLVPEPVAGRHRDRDRRGRARRQSRRRHGCLSQRPEPQQPRRAAARRRRPAGLGRGDRRRRRHRWRPDGCRSIRSCRSVVSLLILRSTWLLLKASTGVLMEGVPAHLSYEEIGQALWRACRASPRCTTCTSGT